MARKTNDDHRPEVLINIIDRYYSEKEPVKRPKYSELGAFARSIGYDIGNHIFQHSTEVREHLDRLSETSEDKILLSVAVYDTLDTEKFMKANDTSAKLRNALQERDRYYHSVCSSAGKIFEKNKELVEEISRLKTRNKELESQNKALSGKVSELATKCRGLIDQDKKLREIIDTYVYPEIANELLKKDGLLKDTAGVVKKEAVEKEVLNGSSDIGGLIKSMFKVVDKE